MRILATISDPHRLAIVVDLTTGKTTQTIPMRPEYLDHSVVGRPPCRPFGITWGDHQAFIANNRQLIVLDQRLCHLRIAPLQLQVNTHQLAYHGGRVWAVSPWTNSVIGIDPRGRRAVELHLLTHTLGPYRRRAGTDEDDRCHFNSLLWADGKLFVAAHAFGGSSFVFRYDARSLRFQGVSRNLGSSLHGLAWHHGELFWISTKTAEIRSDRGYRFALSRQGYARGLAMTDRHIIVAISEYLARDERVAGDSWIHVIDRTSGTVQQDLRLRDTGSINDLRLLDSFDHAHRVAPIWPRGDQASTTAPRALPDDDHVPGGSAGRGPRQQTTPRKTDDQARISPVELSPQ